jgi:hypothetical protein
MFPFHMFIVFCVMYYRIGSDNKAHHVSISKPMHSDSISVKEKFIQAKVCLFGT